MNFQIRLDGSIYWVRTEVGDGLTRMVFDAVTETPAISRAEPAPGTTVAEPVLEEVA